MVRFKIHRGACCVFGCFSKDLKSKTKFFKLPIKQNISRENDLLFLKWVSAVKLPGRITPGMAVCDRHFTQDDFDGGGDKLKEKAVPSLNLPTLWRNKFYPRDYGRLVKLLEFRGIGRLRLCYEAKLVRKLRKIRPNKISSFKSANEDLKIQVLRPFSLQNSCINKDLESLKKKTFVNKFNSNIDTTQNLCDNIDLTSEITIKEEPIFGDETVEEMLARMNEDSNEPINLDRSSDISVEIICAVCDKDDCPGHNDNEINCDICGKVFNSLMQIRAHKLSHPECRKRRKNTSSNKENQSHICMLCEETFNSKAKLMEHVDRHTMVYLHQCSVCKISFYSQEELDVHFKKHKIIKREYSCRECDKRFKSKAACWEHLNQHLRAKRPPGLPCEICGRSLATKATLKEHMFLHSGEKPFECQLCGRKIRHRANFINHVQGHSLGEPYLCTSCGMGFSRKTELNSHITLEHPDDKPFHCIICNLRFRTEARFHKHAFTHDAQLEE